MIVAVDVRIEPTRPDHPQVVAALGALDAYLGSLYAPDENHILSVDELLAPDIVFLGAWQGDRLVGTGAARCMPGEPDTGGEPYGEIKRMYVEPACRGQRLGARLVQSLERSLRDRGVSLALLETGRDQLEAVRLYERSGYVRRGAFGGYPDNGLSLFMAKRLNGSAP